MGGLVIVPVSVGVCAHNEGGRIRGLLESIRAQGVPSPFEIVEILVVASGCTDATETEVRDYAKDDSRVRLVHQPVRLGKVAALNEILRSYEGSLLVLVNADARLAPESLAHLVRPFLEIPAAQVACGAPVPFAYGNSLPRSVEEIQWRIHNRSLEVLSSLDAANHCCDELMAVRRGFVKSLPPDLINDGAYVGVVAAQRGLTVRFCADAKVYVRGPRDLHGLVQQRRRILLGHFQIRDLLHRSPNTLEEIAKRNPKLAVSILLGELRSHPSYLAFFFLVNLPVEIVSMVLAFMDRAWSSAYSPVWPKVDEQ